MPRIKAGDEERWGAAEGAGCKQGFPREGERSGVAGGGRASAGVTAEEEKWAEKSEWTRWGRESGSGWRRRLRVGAASASRDAARSPVGSPSWRPQPAIRPSPLRPLSSPQRIPSRPQAPRPRGAGPLGVRTTSSCVRTFFPRSSLPPARGLDPCRRSGPSRWCSNPSSRVTALLPRFFSLSPPAF